MDVRMPDGTIIQNVPEGITRSQLEAKLRKLNQPKEEQGVGRTIFDQSLQGATFGLADEVQDRIGAGIASLMTDESYDDLLQEARGMSQDRLQEQLKQRPALSIASNLAGGLLTGGAASTTKAGTAIGNSLRSGGLPARMAKGFAAGATSGAAYGAGSAKEGERLEGAKQGAIYGGVGGAALPAAGAALKGAGDAIIPVIDDAIKPLAHRAKDFNIPLRLDQVSPTRARRTIQKVSQELPFSGSDAFEDVQRRAFNKALAKTIGQEADDLSPEIIQKFLNEADAAFNVVPKSQQFPASGIARKLQAIVADAFDNVGDEFGGIVERNASKILPDLASNKISGAKLSAIRSGLVKKLPRVDSRARPYVAEFIDAIDAAVTPRLSDSARKTLADARRHWRNYKTLEPLLEKATDGMINPTELLNRVKASPYIKASRAGLGDDDLVDLARIGKQFLPKQGGSDTYQKIAIAGGVPATIVEPTAGASIAAGLGANRAFQRAYNSSQKLVDTALKRTGGGTPIGGTTPSIGVSGAAAQIDNAIGGVERPRATPDTSVLSGAKGNAAVDGDINNDSLQSDYFQRLAMAESGGNPNAKAKTSSASGLYQITNDTWRNLVRKHGKKHGITIGMKNDAEAQNIMVRYLTAENSNALANFLKRKPTDGELYLAHFAGAAGAKRLLKTKNKNVPAVRLSPAAAKANPTIFYADPANKRKPFSVAQVIEILSNKVQ